MKYNLSYFTIIICLLFSVTLLAQTKKYKVTVKRDGKVMNQASNKVDRKIMIRDKYAWVYATNTTRGHWARLAVNEREKFEQLLKVGDTLYPVRFNEYKTYKEASRYSSSIPKKAFEKDKFEEHPEWITKIGSLVKPDGSSRLEMEGAIGKTNVYYHKNINLLHMNFAGYNKYDFPETNIASTDHIVVTDTLLIPLGSLGFMNIHRRNRGYVKIIANCIIYERPIKVSSTLISDKTDFVFSAREILLKSPYKDLTETELNPSPPFIWKVDTNVETYVDPFAENESLLINRLMINTMIQTSTELQNPNIDYWEKDKLLARFQTTRGRVNSNILVNDSEYLNVFNDLCNDFTKYENEIIDANRTIDDLTILVEGEIRNLPKEPFKYYAIPTTTNLIPVFDKDTGKQNMIGDIYFRAVSDSKLLLTLETRLGYDKKLFNKARRELLKKKLVLEKSPSEAILYIDEQPLRINGKVIGRIVPISNQILRLKIDLPDEDLSLLELFPESNNITFDVTFKAYNRQKEYMQKIALKLPKKLMKNIDYTSLIDKFNKVESNTITDLIKISSQLKTSLPDEGPLKYCEIKLEFLFENNVMHKGPFSLSATGTLASEMEIEFVKYSENYSIKVSGTAFYEDGKRDIKDNTIMTGKFIILEEGLFKN